MDLYLYARVLWRFRLLVLSGLALAFALATLSVLRIGPDGVTYRDSRLWAADMKVAVTQRGCPECRLYAQWSASGQEGTSTPVSPRQPVTDPARLATLARYYAQLMTSDPVRSRAARSGLTGKIIATPIRDDQSGVILPYIDIVSISTSAEGAMKYADASVQALGAFLLAQQRASNVAEADRVIIQPIIRPNGAVGLSPSSEDDADRRLLRGDVRNRRTRVRAGERQTAIAPARPGEPVGNPQGRATAANRIAP